MQNKVVIINGASSGIGKALAEKYASEGFKLVLAARRIERLNALKDKLDNVEVLCIKTDVSIEKDCKNLINSAVEKFGKIDILINNAGISMRASIEDVEIEDDVSGLEAASKGLALLYEALTTPLYGLKILAFILSVFLWLLDLFIYPLFLAERFFLLGIMQAFFPLVISLAVFEKFRSMAYTFFKLYAAVYMLVPAFFLVNVFVNALYTEFTTNFWVNLFGFDFGSSFFAPIIELGTIGFIVFLKFKLYKRATSFTFKLFSA